MQAGDANAVVERVELGIWTSDQLSRLLTGRLTVKTVREYSSSHHCGAEQADRYPPLSCVGQLDEVAHQ
jgi:hypothetical protein